MYFILVPQDAWYESQCPRYIAPSISWYACRHAIRHSCRIISRGCDTDTAWTFRNTLHTTIYLMIRLWDAPPFDHWFSMQDVTHIYIYIRERYLQEASSYMQAMNTNIVPARTRARDIFIHTHIYIYIYFGPELGTIENVKLTNPKCTAFYRDNDAPPANVAAKLRLTFMLLYLTR